MALEDSLSDMVKYYVKHNVFSGDDYPDKDEDIIAMLVEQQNITHNVPTTLEQLYYRLIFEKYYGNVDPKVIPYFWMPRYVKADDASARSLNKKLEIIKILKRINYSSVCVPTLLSPSSSSSLLDNIFVLLVLLFFFPFYSKLFLPSFKSC